MKVKYIRNDGNEPSLTFNNTYFIVGVEFSSKSQEPSKYIQFRVLDDELQVTLCEAKDFEIIKGEIDSNWEFVNRKENDYTIIPKLISYNSFWENYYDDDKLAVKALNDVYIELISKYSTDCEIKEMINSKDAIKATNAIKSLRLKSENQFDELVVNRIKHEIHELMNYSNPKVNSLILEGFEYLSEKTSDAVEELFLGYYEQTILHCEKMDEIVSGYFSNKS